MLALKSAGAALALLLAAFIAAAIAQPPREAAPDDAMRWVRSLVATAKTEMGIELPPECVQELTAHIAARGFKRGAVTSRGSVLVRDADGADVWVCR